MRSQSNLSRITLAHGATATCPECGFSSADVPLFNAHSCDVQSFGGRCEDYPCCGHEAGDCNGQLYGSDEAIIASVHDAWANGHGYCDHAEGIYECDVWDDDDYYDE